MCNDRNACRRVCHGAMANGSDADVRCRVSSSLCWHRHNASVRTYEATCSSRIRWSTSLGAVASGDDGLAIEIERSIDRRMRVGWTSCWQTIDLCARLPVHDVRMCSFGIVNLLRRINQRSCSAHFRLEEHVRFATRS